MAVDAAADTGARERAVGGGGGDDDDGGGGDVPLAPQPEATRLTGRRHCARAKGEPIVRAFGGE